MVPLFPLLLGWVHAPVGWQRAPERLSALSCCPSCPSLPKREGRELPEGVKIHPLTVFCGGGNEDLQALA